MEINLKQELRPCIIAGKRKGLFHCWEQIAEPIAPGLTIGSHPGGQFSQAAGLVELEDGRMMRADPNVIRFTDNKMAEYAFEDDAKEGEKYVRVKI